MTNYDPFEKLPGGFSVNDGTIDFYSRVRALTDARMTVLDLGAGRGAWFHEDRIFFRRQLRHLRGHVARMIAADVDEAVRINPAADESLLMEGNTTIPVDDKSIDLIICDYVLEHVDDPATFCAEIDRVLKSGGWLCPRTPHKYAYVSIAARLVLNRNHASLLKLVQPDRVAEDVFPTRYRMNTLGDVVKSFPGYENRTFIFRTDPAYYFGRKWIFSLLSFLHKVLPAPICGNIFLFVRKQAN